MINKTNKLQIFNKHIKIKVLLINKDSVFSTIMETVLRIETHDM